MSITITQIAEAIESTLSAATGLTYTQAPDELTEGMQNWPLLQVYWDESTQDPSGNTDRTTFKAGVRQTVMTFFADLYVRPRSHIGEDIGALLPLIDAIQDVMEQQNTRPYFGLEGIQAFSWSAKRVVFAYGGAEYIGARLTIEIRVF